MNDSDAKVAAGTGFRADGTPDVFNAGCIDRLFESEGEMTPRRQQRRDKLRELQENARAKTTTQGYNRHVKSFVAFCEAERIADYFPASREILLEWVAELSFHEDDHTGEHYQTSYIGQAVSAVAKWHTSHGFPNPADDDVLRTIRMGYGHFHGRNPRRADPILREALGRLIDTTYAPTRAGLRDRFLILMRTDDDNPLGPRGLERLASWDDVIWPSTDDEPAWFRLTKGMKESLVPIPRHADPAFDAVGALRELHDCSNGTGPVLLNPRGVQMGYSGISRRLTEIFAAAGVSGPEGVRVFCNEDRNRLLDIALERTDIQVRDGAMIGLEWLGANRRGEVGEFRWADLTPTPEDPTVLRMTVRRSKTDQKSDGKVRMIYPQSNPRLDPFTQLAQWRERAERILGRAVQASDHVFFRLDQPVRGKGVPEKLSGNAVNDRVKAAVAAAGLLGRYSSHSLRSGFATQAFHSKYESPDVQEHLGQADPRSPMIYKRGSARLGTHNPSRDPVLVEAEETDRVTRAVLRRVLDRLGDEDGGGEEALQDLVSRIAKDELANGAIEPS